MCGLIVAGTDTIRCGCYYRHFLVAGMTAQVFAYQEDQFASNPMLALDPQGLSQIGPQWHITTCGVTPTTAGLSACKELSATAAMVVRYLTSEDVSGDLATVVGYARLWLRKIPLALASACSSHEKPGRHDAEYIM